jgi:hypothetical protein
MAFDAASLVRKYFDELQSLTSRARFPSITPATNILRRMRNATASLAHRRRRTGEVLRRDRPREVGDRPIFIRESGNDEYYDWVKAVNIPAP